ncbi:MAG TPA: aminotransferase class V-fold PLP-dependent enzyme [Thermoanaerobaculia bacterium]|jgi:cysteine desulfurase/selenocysteine lyase|nr:aminotransferase class V-fold PLP-dependent enzyme [Thermoanaerobaculia bacterium]
MPFDFSLAALDREFPVRRNLLYFNHAALSPLPRRVADAMTAHVANARDRGAADWRSWYGMIEAVRGKAARLIGANAAEIAFLPNTSWGVNLVALGFPWREGDNVVTDDMEFPSNAYPWRGLAARGVECRVAKNRAGRIGVEDIAALVDARTRVVAVSWVAFHTGFVFPVEAIGRLCRERGILFVVDAIQGLGALPLDVEAARVDVLCADAHKWLYGTEGGAVFYVHEGAREKVPARAAGWWNVKSEGEYLEYRNPTRYAGARRYEPGTLPTANVAALGAALDLLAEMGPAPVLARILEAAGALRVGLAARGWRIASPEPLASGILAAVSPSGNARGWAKALEMRGVIVAPREGAVRFSPHAGNDLGEVARALAVIDAIGDAP